MVRNDKPILFRKNYIKKLKSVFNAFQYITSKNWIRCYVLMKLKEPEINQIINQTGSVEVWLGKESKYLSLIFQPKKTNFSQRYKKKISFLLDSICNTLKEKDSVTNRQRLLNSVSFTVKSFELNPTCFMDILLNVIDNFSIKNFKFPLFVMLCIFKINFLVTLSILNTT